MRSASPSANAAAASASRFVDQQHLLIGRRVCEFQLLNVQPLAATAAFEPAFAASVFDQNAPHSFAGRGKKMRAVLPGLVFLAD